MIQNVMNQFSPYAIFQLTIALCFLAYIFLRFIFKKFTKRDQAQMSSWINSKLSFILEISSEWDSPKSNHPIVIENPFRGLLITGSVGSGKTKSIIEPIIIQAVQKNFTGLLYDYESPVLSNLFYTSFKRSQSNVKDYYVNFEDLSRSNRLNPLNPKHLISSAYAREYAHTILGNIASEFIHKPSFWTRSSESLLAAAIWFLKEKHSDQCTLPHAVSILLTEDIERLLQRLSQSDESAGMVASIRSGLNSVNQTAGVISTLQNALAVLNTPSLFWVLSGNDLDLNLNDPDNPKFLAVANTPALASTYSPVISLIFSAALKQMNQQGKQHSTVIIDELPTLYVPNLDRIPATARKNRIATILCVQDFSQMEDTYGDKKTEVITSVLANQLYGKTTNPKTAERISRIYGKDDKMYLTTSSGRSGLQGSHSISQSIQERPNVKPQQIVNLETGQFYGSLVESWRNIFRCYFKHNEYEVDGIEKFSNVSEYDVKENFKRIRSEANQIIEGTFTDTNNSDNEASEEVRFTFDF